MAISYMFQFLDKTALSFTAILDLPQDLHLNGLAFSWASGVYYVGYLIATYPAGIIMVRWKVGKTIACSAVLWGISLMLTAVVSNAAGLIAVRFFLGVFEAPIAPGLSIMISMWYKRNEQPLRQTAWFLGNTTAGIVGALMAYAIGHVQGIATWKAVFIIFGAVTTAWSMGLFWLLPDVPMTAWFLSPPDRVKAIARVKDNMTGIKNDEFKWRQFREAMLDINAWGMILITLTMNMSNGGLLSFNTIVLEGLGFDRLRTLLLQSATYLFQLFLLLFCATMSSRLANKRILLMVLNFLLSIIGCALVRQLPAHLEWPRYVGYILTIAFSANYPLMLSLVSSNVGGFTKKVTVTGMVVMAYCAGNVIGPQFFIEAEAPSYNSAFLAVMMCFGISTVMCFVLRFSLWRQNRARDQLQVIQGRDVDNAVLNLLDKTDKELHTFRYVY
ncbi:major facilitator superfamily transporter [Ophiocordyceps camponoti-floridani]|uniref:Major facilitator superfamily transporter n=1 Tax=Ophiocordyceps camponoti-floridani TaxID=2030778 RepID=A0A8H4VD12_9HYPO|nr:major facilitator superfamily transporter [Ophiocordyceps camponoti-floridani]